MRAVRHESIAVSQSADAVFQAALGVVQNAKNTRILAVHDQARKIVTREKPKMSNAKFQEVWVQENGDGATLNVAVGTDPRTPKALLDGKFNGSSLAKLVENIQAVLAGTASAPVTPVPNHYLQKKEQVAWLDPNEDPQIELDGNLLALYGL
ncbi:MAG: hypothetical protein QM621_03320 [Aeromicrobium sp.]|uniref:hypothetical protein n=1 Tax=Aeromicrobium sp. TaxID=1871063 RepID=UPI0039E4ED69